MGTQRVWGAEQSAARDVRAQKAVATLSAFQRVSPLGFPFAIIATLTGIGILSPTFLVLAAGAAGAFALHYALKRPQEQREPRRPLGGEEIQSLLQSQFRPQPRMRYAARRAEAARRRAEHAPMRRPVREDPLAQPRAPYFAALTAVLLMGIGVPLLLAQGSSAGAGVLVAACVFFLLATVAPRQTQQQAGPSAGAYSPAPSFPGEPSFAREPRFAEAETEPLCLKDLLERALADEGEEQECTGFGGAFGGLDPHRAENLSPEPSSERLFPLALPEDDGTDPDSGAPKHRTDPNSSDSGQHVD